MATAWQWEADLAESSDESEAGVRAFGAPTTEDTAPAVQEMGALQPLILTSIAAFQAAPAAVPSTAPADAPAEQGWA